MKNRMICLVVGHRLEEIARLTDRGHMLGCTRCKDVFGYDSDVDIMLPWGIQMADMYRRLRYSKYQQALKKYDKWILKQR